MGRVLHMKKRRKTIKSKILLVTLSFTFVITVLVSFISFYLYQAFMEKKLIQSTEFNLQLISGTISQNIAYLDTLCDWCRSDDGMLSFLRDPDSTSGDALKIYNSLSAEYQRNRTGEYIQRLIITDTKFTKVLQVGKNAGFSDPVTVYNVNRYFPKIDNRVHAWEDIQKDPLAWDDGATAYGISVIRPIYYSLDNEVVGYLYLLVSTDLITDQLKDYKVESDSSLYLTLGRNNYVIQSSRFRKETLAGLRKSTGSAAGSLSSSMDVLTGQSGNGLPKTLVRCKIGNTDIALSNSISNKDLESQRIAFFFLVILIGFCIIALGILIVVFLNKTITAPVLKIQARIQSIAKGDFSYDPNIEGDNELGEIGHGINNLSRNVNTLMEKRLADEKKRQDMEYQLLQSQISPHFLYNALNSIKWMATIQGSVGIANMTTSLARLLKNIAKGTQKIIPLSSEIQLIDDYFLIQKYRFGGSITLKKEIADDVKDSAIPKFTLQPLVENAIYHGIEPKGGAGTVELKADRTENGDVAVTVTDDGVGIEKERIDEIFSGKETCRSRLFKQIGILNVHKRIQYEFGHPYGLTITSRPGVSTKVTILLPGNRIT